MAQLANDLEVFLDLAHCHLVQRCNFKVRLICISLSNRLAAVRQKQAETTEPENSCHPSELEHRELGVNPREIHRLRENVNVITEPVKEVKSARGNIDHPRKVIRVALGNQLDPLCLEHRLEYSEDLSRFSNALRNEVVLNAQLGVVRELVPRAKLAEVLAELDNLVTTLYKSKKNVSLSIKTLQKNQMARLIKTYHTWTST